MAHIIGLSPTTRPTAQNPDNEQTATTMTMNSPDGLTELYDLATDSSKDKEQSVQTAELMREVGLKCIGFNGVRSSIHTFSHLNLTT
jgi:hypothetical protein